MNLQVKNYGELVNATDNEGRNAIHKAVIQQDCGLVVFLIKRGGNVNAGDRRKITPFHLAAEMSTPSMLKTLLSQV